MIEQMKDAMELIIVNWPEISATGFDGLRLGDHIHDIRERFGEFRSFRRTRESDESDQFVNVGIMVTYDDEGVVTFIELTRPTDPTLHGVKLLERPLGEVVADLEGRGISARWGSTTWEGPILEGLGIALWEPVDTVECVSIGRDESA